MIDLFSSQSTTPELSNFDSLLDSVPTLTASWLTPQASTERFIPTNIKQVRTSAPVDMKAAKERRVEGKQAAKQRKKDRARRSAVIISTAD